MKSDQKAKPGDTPIMANDRAIKKTKQLFT
jgi:hypothetical protein